MEALFLVPIIAPGSELWITNSETNKTGFQEMREWPKRAQRIWPYAEKDSWWDLYLLDLGKKHFSDQITLGN